MTAGRKKIHEDYHKDTSSQYKIIEENNFTYRHLIKHINKYLKDGDKVLDIGCGAGTLDLYYASKGYSVTGIDISKTAIISCNQSKNNLNIKNIKFVVDDFQNTKLKQKYDFIIFTEVIEHLPNDKLALRSINKLLKKNGTLFLSTPSIKAPIYKMGLADNFDKEVGHLRRYDKEKLIKLIESSNFTIIESSNNEGILRNFLFLNKYAGKLIRFIKYIISDIITLIDNISLKLFGESNYFIVAKK